jgi:superfamily I DNA/RNA helicase
MDENVIDFSDMLWLPQRWQLHPPPVDYLFVDEAQDLSPAQLELVLRSRADGGRMLFVGDPAQSIFAFAGADAESFWQIKARTSATELPLSICYRCPRSHLRIAQKIVPHIQSRPDAPEGVVEHLPEAEFPQHIREGDLVLCRMTAPLVGWCIRLIQAGISARVRGVDVGASLIQLARRVGETETFTYRLFLDYLGAFEAEQQALLAQRRNSAGRLQSLKDKCDALRVAYQSFAVNDLDDLCRAIHQLFADQRPPVWLSTIHRAKGLESDCVFILYPHRLPLEWPEQQPWEWVQELNLRYVAVTRARQRLVILQPEGLSVDYADDSIDHRIVQKRGELALNGTDQWTMSDAAEAAAASSEDTRPAG